MRPHLTFETVPSARHNATVSPYFAVPLEILPTAIFPIYSSWSMLAILTCKGSVAAPVGAGTLSKITSWGGLKTIGQNAFKSTGFTTISIPKEISSIGSGAFNIDKLTEVHYEGTTNT